MVGGNEAAVVAAMTSWLERAVIGLNLCPFAKAVHVKRQVHFAVSAATAPDGVLQDLARELDALCEHAPVDRETTLLVVPDGLGEFLEFNEVVARGNRLVRKRGLEGVIQLASFHPAYCFADLQPDDMANFSNRSPFPTLHLLREDAIKRAVEAIADPREIYAANIRRLREIGPAGWAALEREPGR
jgi:uncharacterized protein